MIFSSPQILQEKELWLQHRSLMVPWHSGEEGLEELWDRKAAPGEAGGSLLWEANGSKDVLFSFLSQLRPRLSGTGKTVTQEL